MENRKPSPIAVGEDDLESISVVGDNYRILISGKQTGGDFATIDMLIPKNGGPPPHSHTGFHETFYVVDGEVEVTSEAGSYTAKKGAYVVIPKGGIIHEFHNHSDNIAHLLCTVVPAGLEEMFIAIGKPVGRGEFLPQPPPPDAEEQKKSAELAAKYGQTLYPPGYLKDKE